MILLEVVSLVLIGYLLKISSYFILSDDSPFQMIKFSLLREHLVEFLPNSFTTFLRWVPNLVMTSTVSSPLIYELSLIIPSLLEIINLRVDVLIIELINTSLDQKINYVNLLKSQLRYYGVHPDIFFIT